MVPQARTPRRRRAGRRRRRRGEHLPDPDAVPLRSAHSPAPRRGLRRAHPRLARRRSGRRSRPRRSVLRPPPARRERAHRRGAERVRGVPGRRHRRRRRTCARPRARSPAPGTIGGVRLYREALIHVQTASALDGATGPWPDALVPDVDELAGERRNAFPFAVPAGESRAIWVEVFVPPDAPAGEYTGAVDVTLGRRRGDGAGGAHRLARSRSPRPPRSRRAFGFTYGAIPSGARRDRRGRVRRAARALRRARARPPRHALARSTTAARRPRPLRRPTTARSLDGAAPTALARRAR